MVGVDFFNVGWWCVCVYCLESYFVVILCDEFCDCLKVFGLFFGKLMKLC